MQLPLYKLGRKNADNVEIQRQRDSSAKQCTTLSCNITEMLEGMIRQAQTQTAQ